MKTLDRAIEFVSIFREPILFIVLPLLVVGGLIRYAAVQPDEWKVDCERRDGRVLSDTDTHVGNSYTNGKVGVVVASSTTRLCIDPDGRVLSID